MSSGGVNAKFAAKRGHYLLIKGSLLFIIESNVLESSGNKYHKPRMFMHIRIAHFAHMTWFAGFKKVGDIFPYSASLKYPAHREVSHERGRNMFVFGD